MAGLPKVSINVTGGITRPAANEDGISGYVFYNDNIADLTTFSTTNRIVKFTNLPAIEAIGITASSTNFKEEHYQIKEHFRAGGAELYIGIFDVPAVSYDFKEITSMHLFSSGKIRLYGVYASKNDLVVGDLALINTEIAAFESTKQPAFAVYGANTGSLEFSALADLRSLAADLPYVSYVVGQDTEGVAATLSVTNGVPNVGIVIGTLSQAAVNENILNVGKYNYSDGVNMVIPGFFLNDGATDNNLIPVTNYAAADLDTLNDSGYIFWRYFSNLDGTYLSNDNNCVDNTDTFNSIHIMRTRNKVERVADKALTPLIGSTVLFNTNGTMKSSSISVFESALAEEMQNMLLDVEISAYDIYIDPSQDVLSTKTVAVELSIIPTESADYITLNVSFVSEF